MRGNFEMLRSGLFAAAILLTVSACQSAEPAAIDNGSDATCGKMKPDKSEPECKQREAIATKLAALNYCFGEHTFSTDERSVWTQCTASIAIETPERKWAVPVEIQAKGSSDFEGNSTALVAAKINMLARVQDVSIVEKVLDCGLRQQIWYYRAKDIVKDRIQAEATRERLTDEERQQLSVYTAQHVRDIPLTCSVLAKTPLIAELDHYMGPME